MPALATHDVHIDYLTEPCRHLCAGSFTVYRYTGSIIVTIRLLDGPHWVYTLPEDARRFFAHLACNGWGLLPGQYAWLRACLTPDHVTTFWDEAQRAREHYSTSGFDSTT